MFICSLWDVKEPTHYSRRVGDEVPGVVAALCEYMDGWVGLAGPHQLNSCRNFNLLKQINNKQITNKQNLWNVRSEACAVDCGVIMSAIRGIDTRDDVTLCGWQSYNLTAFESSTFPMGRH